jgi:hypothetical protein
MEVTATGGFLRRFSDLLEPGIESGARAGEERRAARAE